MKSFSPKQLQLWRRQGRYIRSGRLNQDVRGGACSLVPRQCVWSDAVVEDMAQWDADRYSQLSGSDHHTIVTTRLVARVLPGFECRSGVSGHFVGDACHTSWAKTCVRARPAVSVRHILLGSRAAPRVICCNRDFVSTFAVKPGDFPRLSLELSTDVAVRSSEAWRRPVGLNGTARLVHSSTSVFRAARLSLAANAIDGGSKPRRFCDAEKHACILHAISPVQCQSGWMKI